MAWTLLYPRFSVVVPEGATIKIPLAYLVTRRDAAFATFVDLFVDLQRKEGTLDALYAHSAAPAPLTSRAGRSCATFSTG